jgi:transcriptional regulator with XRE-family HTH domain
MYTPFVYYVYIYVNFFCFLRKFNTLTNEELTRLRKDLRLTQDQMAEKLGITRSYLNRLESGKTMISDNVLLRINSLFASAPKKESGYLIPYFDIDATATPMEIFNEDTNIPSTSIDLPGFAGCDFAINVSGHALYPAIESGSMIICKKITDKSIILYGEIYFIVTKDYRFVRRLKKSSKKGYVLCAADNHNGRNSSAGLTYESVEIPVDKIIHLYIVKGAIKRLQI